MALARGPAAKEHAEWHRAVAPGVEVGEITSHGLALSRLKQGFESRREGPKGSGLVRTQRDLLQSYEGRGTCASHGKSPRWFRTRDEATSGSGESHAGSRRRRGDCSSAGQGPPAFLPVGGAHHRPPFPNQEGVEGRLPRPGDRRLGPHSSASPAGQRQKPGCAWLRGVPCSAAFCTLVCCKSARLLEAWPTNPLPSTINPFCNVI